MKYATVDHISRFSCASRRARGLKMCINISHSKYKTKNFEKSPLFCASEKRLIGFPLSKRPKEAENTPSCHHACSHHRFRDIRLEFTSVRLILKTCFPYICRCCLYTLMNHFRFRTILEKIIQKH